MALYYFCNLQHFGKRKIEAKEVQSKNSDDEQRQQQQRL